MRILWSIGRRCGRDHVGGFQVLFRATRKNSYDVRLYLNDLSETIIGTNRSDNKREEEEAPEEVIEEELCEEERWADLKKLSAPTAPKELQPAESRRKGAEVAYQYEKEEEEEDDGISNGSDDESEEPYKPPEVLRIPVGTTLPSNVRLGHLIERTARFVAHNGNQMEIVIKAKHRKDQQRFAFLEFDNPLNPFYKFLCKAIREKKWDPPPPAERRLPGEHFVPNRPPEDPNKKKNGEEEEESESDNEGYLHPLLMVNKSARNSVNSPAVPLPPPPTSKSFVNLYEQLHSDPPPSTSKTPAAPLVLPPEEKSEVEKDPIEAKNYELWHQWFYGRPSPFAPRPPPPLSNPSDVLFSQINTLAKYVAANGPPAEQQAIEHNKWQLEFFFPDSKHHITYHNRVRYYQTQTRRSNLPPFVRSKYHPANPMDLGSGLTLPIRPLEQQIPMPPVPKPPTPPEPPKIREFPSVDVPPLSEDEQIKRIRKERAQQFMSDLLRQKAMKAEPASPSVVPKEPEIVVPADIVVPSLIQQMVGTQLKRITAADRDSREGSREKPPDRSSERRRQESSRSRSRSPSSRRRRRSRSRSRRRSHRKRSRSREHKDDRKRKHRRRSRSSS